MPLSSVFGDRSGSASDQILSVLRAVRRHLGMDVGFVSEFVEGNRVFRFSDSETLHGPSPWAAMRRSNRASATTSPRA